MYTLLYRHFTHLSATDVSEGTPLASGNSRAVVFLSANPESRN